MVQELSSHDKKNLFIIHIWVWLLLSLKKPCKDALHFNFQIGTKVYDTKAFFLLISSTILIKHKLHFVNTY